MKVSIKKISEVTGFSQATVCNALNHKRGVNKTTSAQIIKAAKELGYISEASIFRIKIIIYRKSGSVIEDSPFFSLVMDGAEVACRAAGLELIAVYLDKRNSEYQDQIRWLISDTTSGLIVIGSELEEEELDRFRIAKCPVMLIDYWCNDMSFNSLMANNSASMVQVVEYLVKKGHKKIGYLRGKIRIYPFRARSSALRSALAQHNLQLADKYTVTISTSMDGSYNDMAAYLKTDPVLPSAFFADNDVIAVGAMKALKEFGYRIPEDISLIGFDDLPFCEITSPKLTTIRTVKKELGQMAVEKILDMVKNGDHIKTKVEISTTFIERDSVRQLGH